MPVTEVQWIGASCGRHSSYTFYKGFRLIVDGVVKNFCLGEFYFVKNSISEPICIAELQLVWHDASTDSKLASARLYFRPEDTPTGRLPSHGQDELLYADQKVVVKCCDMAVWEDSGSQWNCGMIPLLESDFACIEDRYYLNSLYFSKEKERLRNAKRAWQEEEKPRCLKILTFPAYCRYRALKKRLLSGACLSRAQWIALGGGLGDQSSSTRVLFCRENFHHPHLDKFELSGDNKAPVLKGRPRKKRRFSAPQNNVLKKKRLMADIQNHLTSVPSAKRVKVSHGDESASSDLSEDVLQRTNVPQNVTKAVQNSDPLPLEKPKVQAVPKVVVPVVLLAHPPPLISTKSNVDAQQLTQEQPKMTECSQTTPMQNHVISSKNTSSTKDERVSGGTNAVLLDEAAKEGSIHTRVTSALLTKPSVSLDSQSGKMQNSSLEKVKVKKTGIINHIKELTQTITTDLIETSSFPSNSQPVATTQGTFETQLAVSTGPVKRIQPVATLSQPVIGAQPISSRPQRHTAPLSGTVSSGVKSSNVAEAVSCGMGGKTADSSSSVGSKPSKENDERLQQPRLTPKVSNKKKENEIEQPEEAVAWKKKKKRLRMPGSVKDEVYSDEDEKYFMHTLRDFMKKTNQPLGKLPALGFKKVNLWTMYTTAQRFGGYDAVTSKRLWRRVYDSLGGSTTITSAATYTRRHYERLLLPYERHIRSQLKKQIDDKNPAIESELAPKDPLNKTDKKQLLAVSNSKTKSCADPGTGKDADKKHPQNLHPTEANATKVPPASVALSSPQALTVTAKITSNSSGKAMKTTSSSGAMATVTLPNVGKDGARMNMPPVDVRPIKQGYRETTLISKSTRAEISQSSPLPTQKRDNPATPDKLATLPGQRCTQHHYLNALDNDDETSARTNTIYAKNTTKSAQAGCLQRVSRVVSDIAPKSLSSQAFNSTIQNKEIIDLTSDDNPSVLKLKSHSLSHVECHPQNAVISKKEGLKEKEVGISQMPRTAETKDSSARRLAPKPLLKREREETLRHHSIAKTHSRNETTTLFDSHTYNVEPQGKQLLKVSLSRSPVSTMRKNSDELYPSVKPEVNLPKHDKKRHQQSKIESVERQFAHSPSSESVDEHFAEWRRRQASTPQPTKPPVSNQRHHLEQAQFKYSYVHEDSCPPDCPCSLPKSRKDEKLLLPKPKKEHFEEDLPFANMTWAPTMVAPGHPDHYIYSHPAHLRPPMDSLASHVYSASRIFIPSAQIFNPPYHLGMAPMGAPPLLAGAEDQIHIHPHCLMASSYPTSSSSRTPDGAAYPLYSFT
ncbi:AT-rich interactive domain-containing protein 5B-like isoform X1 [Montipora capricornis]|uniref:AT-rich interactive domain-containing protein 5B-like isoform X1 n=2 Tax=Montipora capricornis TaxID=246305 RepID=UPI0035F1A9A2